MATIFLKCTDGVTSISYRYTNAVGSTVTGTVHDYDSQAYFTPKSGTTPSITGFTKDETHYTTPCYMYYNTSASEGYTTSHKIQISGSQNISDFSYTRYLMVGATPKTFTLTTGITADYGGYVTMDGVKKTSGSYNYGTSVRLHAVSNDYYDFNRWIENGATLANYTPANFTVSGDRTIKAYFKGSLYSSWSSNITISSVQINGAFSVSDKSTYYRLKVRVYYAGSLQQTVYSTWRNGTTTGYYTHSVNVTGLASGTKFTFYLTVQYLSGSSGVDSDLTDTLEETTKNAYTVSATGDGTYISSVSPSSATIESGSSAQFTATPNSSYSRTGDWNDSSSYQFRYIYGATFLSWARQIGTGTFSNAYANPTTYTPTSSSSIIANGAEYQASTQYRNVVTYNKNHTQASGTMSNSYSAVSTSSTASKAVTISANGFDLVGYRFTGWNTQPDGSGTSYSAGSTTIQYNTTLYAQWERVAFTISATASPSGRGTFTGTGTYNFNQTCTLTATAVNGWQFVKWDDNTTTNPKVFSVTEDKSFTAYFERTSPQSKFYWYTQATDSTKISTGKPINNIKAIRWNALITIINRLQREQGIAESTLPTVNRGERIRATLYNVVKNAIATLPQGGGVNPDKTSGQRINASDFEGTNSVKDAINKAIDYFNSH